MFDDSFKAAFRAAARANGKLYEETITAFYTEAASSWPAKSIMVDGGAHSGMHTRPMATLPTVERVIAVEASPATYAAFDAKIRNGGELAKIELLHAALQEDPELEFIEFHVSTTHSGRSGLNPLLRGRNGVEFAPPVRVPATTIDKLAGGSMDRVRFIKLDLEGGEFGALRGARQTLLAGQPICVFETGLAAPTMNGYTPQDLLTYMESVGLKIANFFGETVDAETLSPARYGWAFPLSTFEEHSARLRRLVAAAFERLGQSVAA